MSKNASKAAARSKTCSNPSSQPNRLNNYNVFSRRKIIKPTLLYQIILYVFIFVKQYKCQLHALSESSGYFLLSCFCSAQLCLNMIWNHLARHSKKKLRNKDTWGTVCFVHVVPPSVVKPRRTSGSAIMQIHFLHIHYGHVWVIVYTFCTVHPSVDQTILISRCACHIIHSICLNYYFYVLVRSAFSNWWSWLLYQYLTTAYILRKKCVYRCIWKINIVTVFVVFL